MSIPNYKKGDAFIFRSPYDQYSYMNGMPCRVRAVFDKEDAEHDIECLPMYEIEFTASQAVIQAWPEELQETNRQ